MEQYKEATVISDCRIHQGGETIGIDLVAVGFIIALILGVVDEDCI